MFISGVFTSCNGYAARDVHRTSYIFCANIMWNEQECVNICRINLDKQNINLLVV